MFRNRHYGALPLRVGTALLFLLLLLALVALAGGRSFAQGETSAGPHDPPLVPNEEPQTDEWARLAATETMTDTVMAVIEEFNRLPQPALPPEGAILELPDPAPAELAAAPAAVYRIYMPSVFFRPLPAQAPTPPTPTPLPPTPTPAPEPEPGPGADVVVVLWPTPSIWTERGTTLAYEIRLDNRGRGAAEQVRVTLPYHRQHFELTHTRLSSDDGDWVSRIGDNSFTVTFGRLDDGERRSGTVYLRTHDWVPHATVLDMRADYEWSDNRDGGDARTNWAPVLVGSGNVDGDWLFLAVNPLEGRPGTVHTFSTNRFLPEEPIVTWLNTPDGVRALDLRDRADAEGRVWVDFSSRDLRPGNYSIVLYGERSRLTAVAAFVVLSW